MTSMRALGYTFESAISDIIDNSISANAKLIELKFPSDPIDCFVAICDDGCGMSDFELFDAMKYGSRIKGEKRDEVDLGRFGLGLKAASMSQCRKLTLVSKKDENTRAYIWDLDVVEDKKDWVMIECSKEQISTIRFIDFLYDKTSGTIVVWENFDLISKSTGSVYAELSRLQDSSAEYISLIFHRFLNRDKERKVLIKTNNYCIVGLDPFLENHPKTDPRRKIYLPIKDSQDIERMVVVQPYVLPFQKDLTQEDKKKSGGVENYRSKQGFYIYRNERLIIWGTWFGRHRDELTKYARIKVDISNTLDDIWGIDIKKQTAKIPGIIKTQLTKAVDEAMDLAVKKQQHRGRIEKVEDDIDYIWNRISQRENCFIYKINRDAKIFDLIKENVSDETWSRIDMVLEEVENAIPYQQIYIDKSQNKVVDDIDTERSADIEAKGHILISLALSIGNNTKNEIIDELFLSEPFSKYPELKEKMISGDLT